jgi:lipoprotein-releasing system ATP-binding protein
MSELLLRARGVSRAFKSGSATIEVLRALELELAQGESVAIVGQSGVGKSTLLHILAGLDPPDAGRVEYRGLDLFGAGPKALAHYRNAEVGFVFQFHYLLPEFSALENVALPFRIGRRGGEFEAMAGGLLERLGLADRLHHRPGALSGGEQQRVAIARALALDPALIFADEPTGNLDPGTGMEVFALLEELQRERGFTLVLATHSERLARGCDRVLRLEQGRLHSLGERETREYFEGLGTQPASDPML